MEKINWINGQAGGTPLSAENLNQMQDNIENAFNNMLQKVFPIGSRYVTQSAETNPSTILGFGEWERFNGLVALGVDETDENMNTIGQTGGEKEHTMTLEEIVEHNHTMAINAPKSVQQYASGEARWPLVNDASASKATSKTGASKPFNIMQPYEIVGYMWIRRA